MAAVSSHRSNGDMEEAHRVSQANSDQWDFSVPDPLESQSTSQSYKQSSRNDRSFSSSQRENNTMRSDNRARPKDIDLNGVNGTGSFGRSAKRPQNDPAYLSPNTDQYGQDITASRSGSEPDSLLDLYKQPRNPGKGARDAVVETKTAEPQPEDAAHMEVEQTADAESGWIHREKLLLIEKKEMRELGITPPAPRTHSRSKSRRDRDRNSDQHVQDEEQEQEVRSAKEGKKRRLHSPIQQEEEPDDLPIQQDTDTRTTEDVATDSPLERTVSPPYRNQNQALRSSSSRIPLPKSVPKDTTTPGKRGVPGENDITPLSTTRSRTNSLNSTNLLNDADPSKTPPSSSRPGSSAANTSPTKPRTSSLPRNASLHTRKPSVTSPSMPQNPAVNTTSTPTAQKPRSTSATSTPAATSTPPSIRPRSRQGLEPRPPTSALNRPEGEPPWLKEMYKPDPRLPPEEQMLPTHAKRLQQEQWELARKESEARQRELNARAGRSEARERSTRPDNKKPGSSASEGDELNERDRYMQGQRAFSPLALHTRQGLVPSSRDGPLPPEPGNSRQGSPAGVEVSPTKSGSGGGGASPTKERMQKTYSPLPPPQTGGSTNTRSAQQPVGAAGGGMNGGSLGGMGSGTNVQGLRNSEAENRAKRVTDPFERERVERMMADEKKAQGRDGMEGGKERTVGCTCCVVM